MIISVGCLQSEPEPGFSLFFLQNKAIFLLLHIWLGIKAAKSFLIMF